MGVFLAITSLLELLTRRDLPRAVRFPVHIFDGMAEPVEGDAEGTIRLARTPPS